MRDDFAEHIYHIGNAHDMHSIIQGGLIPGGRSLKRDRHSVFFTAMNPIYANEDLEEVQYDLVKAGIEVYKNTWRIYQNTVCWCNLKLAQNGLQFYQTRSHATALFNTLLATCIEKVVYMKTGEDLYCKVHQSPRLPRVVLTPNFQHGRQDPSNLEARIRRPSKRTKREVRGNSSLTSRGLTSQGSRRKSAMKVEGNLSR